MLCIYLKINVRISVSLSCQVLNYDVTFNIYVDHSLVRNVSSAIRIRAGEYVVKDLCWKRQCTMALVLKFLIQKMDF